MELCCHLFFRHETYKRQMDYFRFGKAHIYIVRSMRDLLLALHLFLVESNQNAVKHNTEG